MSQIKTTGRAGGFELYSNEESREKGREVQAEVRRRNGEKQTVHAVEHSAVTGDEVTEILDADHALNKRLGKVAYLTHGGAEKGSHDTDPHGYWIEVI